MDGHSERTALRGPCALTSTSVAGPRLCGLSFTGILSTLSVARFY